MSQYTIHVNGTATDFARSTKATVVAEADRLRTKEKVRDLIEVRTAAGSVVYSLKAVKARVITKHTKPFTKTIDLPEDLAALVPDGYVPAYERPRNDAVVLRNDELKGGEDFYAVARRSTGEVVAYVGTTRDAGQVMKEMKVSATA